LTHLHHDALINLWKQFVTVSVIYIVVYFTVPAEVEELSLKPDLHSISLTWRKPILNSYCVTQYVINWGKVGNERKKQNIVSGEINSFVLEDLEAHVEYEVSIRATNVKGEKSAPVTGKTKTGTDGKFEV
jgi:hypothetical protein